MKFRQCLESSIDTGRYFFSLPEHEVIKLKASMVHVLVESYVVIVKNLSGVFVTIIGKIIAPLTSSFSILFRYT